MTAALSVAAARGFEWVACASTGNTSAAMAAYAARAGLRSIVFIPEGKIAWGKLSQSMDCGALTVQLKTDFDGCVRILNDLVRRFPIYLLNSVNPYRLEGQKTPAFEIMEQMEWQVPEHVIVPGGNLANGAALGKGFAEMRHLGLIARVPKISVVQAAGANPLFRSMQEYNGDRLDPVIAETRASAIRIRQSRIVEKDGCNPAFERRLGRTGDRAGDGAGQGADWRGGCRLRARVGRDLGRTEEAGCAGKDHQRGARCPRVDRPHLEGLRLHHPVPQEGASLPGRDGWGDTGGAGRTRQTQEAARGARRGP